MNIQDYDIASKDKASITEWLDDRKGFHKWFTTLIVGSFAAITIFGENPHLRDLSGEMLTISLGLMLFAILCNLVCVWSIPRWKLGVNTGKTGSNFRMKIELDISAWLGVICFVSGLNIYCFWGTCLRRQCRVMDTYLHTSTRQIS